MVAGHFVEPVRQRADQPDLEGGHHVRRDLATGDVGHAAKLGRAGARVRGCAQARNKSVALPAVAGHSADQRTLDGLDRIIDRLDRLARNPGLCELP